MEAHISSIGWDISDVNLDVIFYNRFNKHPNKQQQINAFLRIKKKRMQNLYHLVFSLAIGYSLCYGYINLKLYKISNSKIKLQQSKQNRYLEDMVSRKAVEVENLLRRHSAPDDPLMMKLSYTSTAMFSNATNCIRKPGGPKDDHMMSVIVDVKKKSPTIPSQRNVVDFSSAADYCCLLSNVGVDAFFVNTDDVDYGGSWDDLRSTSRALEKIKPDCTPACIAKDVFIHPIQVLLFLFFIFRGY